MAHCPNLSDEIVRKQHEMLVKAVGENMAFRIWDMNRGNFINKTPTGESSKLFYHLADKVGSFEDAIKLKAQYYTEENYKQWPDSLTEPTPTDENLGLPMKMHSHSSRAEEDPEETNMLNFELFAGQKTIYCEGICNRTSLDAYQHLLDMGLSPYHNHLNGSSLAVKVNSPISGKWGIMHFVSAVAINGQVYIYDMPQDEFLDSDISQGLTQIKLKQTFKPRLIPLTVDDIAANYNLDNYQAGRFIYSILSSELPHGIPGLEALPYSNFMEYIQDKIDNAEEYTQSLLNTIKETVPNVLSDNLTLNDLYEVYHVRNDDAYDREFQEAAAKEIFDALDNIEDKDLNAVVNLLRGKLKIKVRDYLPKKDRHETVQEIIRNIFTPTTYRRRIRFTDSTEALADLKEYLASDDFISDLWNDYFNAYNDKIHSKEELNKSYKFKEQFKQYLKYAKIDGLVKAKDRFNAEQRFYINSVLANTKRITRNFDEKKKISFYTAIIDKVPGYSFASLSVSHDAAKRSHLKASAKLKKAKTLLLYLELNDLNTDELYNIVEAEISRRKAYYDKVGVQYSRDSLTPSISLEKAKRHAEVLKRALPFVEKVNLDENLPVIAQVEPGGKVITLNPTRLHEDTLGHEYGHVLIDLMGGMSNSFIKEAREQLRDSNIEKQVAKKYGDLAGSEAFDKEIVATAIGMEVADIFENREKRSKFANWLLRFFSALKRMFGIEKNNAKQLAKQLTSEKVINVNKFNSKLSNYVQQARTDNVDDILNSMESMDNQFAKPDDTNNKYRRKINGKITSDEYERVSRILTQYKLSISEEEAEKSEAIQTQNRIGRVIHEIASQILKGEKININDTSVEISDEVLNKLIYIVEDIFKDYATLSESVVGDDNIKAAGTIDVFAVHKDTKDQFIFDFKTKKMYNDRGEYVGFKYYNKPYQNEPFSQSIKNAAQLTMYKLMAEKLDKINIKHLNIVPLVTDFEIDEKGKITIKDIALDPKGVITLREYVAAEKIYKNQEKKVKGEPFDITDLEVEDREEDFLKHEIESEQLNETERLRQDAVDIIISRLNRDRARGRNTSVTKALEDVLAYLGSPGVSDAAALSQFVDNAITGINASYNNYLQHMEKERKGDKTAFPVALVQRWHTIFSAYDVLDDINTAIFRGLFDDFEKEDKDAIVNLKDKLADAIFKRNILRDEFKRRGIDKIAKRLSKFSTILPATIKEEARRRFIDENIQNRKNYTQKEWYAAMDEYAENYLKEKYPDVEEASEAYLRKEMVEASRGDIGMIDRWVETPMNSPDPVVAAMIKKFSITYHNVRLTSNEYRDDLIDILQDLEEQLGYSPSMNPAEFYSFMLERNKAGELTGYILSNLSSEYYEAYENVKKEAAKLPYEERGKKITKWLNENAPLNYKAYNEALFRFVDDLKDRGLMSEEQYVKFSNYNKRRSRRNLQDILDDAELARVIDEWIHFNADEYREPIDKWVNRDWEDFSRILENESDPRTRFYNFIVNTIKEKDRVIPKKDRLRYQLPFMYKSGRERVLAGQKFQEIAGYKIKRYFKKLEDEADRNRNKTVLTDENDNPIKFLPTFFKRNPATFTVKDQSFDLGMLYYSWNKMATHYEQMRDILPDIETVRSILETRKYAAKDPNGNFLYKAMSILGVDKKIFSRGKTNNILAQYDDYIDALVYGNKSLYTGDVNLGFAKIDKQKLANTVGKFTSLSLLGFNVLAGIVNVSYGSVQNAIEAYSGEFYTLKDLSKASGQYWNLVIDVLDDIGKRRPESLLGQLVEQFDILNDYSDPNFRKSTRWSNLIMSNTAYFLSHAGEHYMQSRVFMAMLMKVPAYDKNGKYLGNMLEMYEKNEKTGRLQVKSEVDLVKSNWTKEEQIIFGEKVKGLLSGLHGEYSELGYSAVQKYALGKMSLMFRKYLVPGVKRRFGKLQYNERIGVYTEGYYRTAFRVWTKFLKDFYSVGLEQASLNKKKLLPREEYAMKRALAEGAFVILFTVLSTALVAVGAAYPPDEDDYVYGTLLNMASYVAMRTNKELQFYYFWNPMPALQILRSPAASLSVVEGLYKLGYQLITDPLEEYKVKGPYKYKITKKFVKALPLFRSIHNVVNVEDLVSIMQMK